MASKPQSPAARKSALQTVRAAIAALPTVRELAALRADALAADARGYYDPVEDERLRDTYARYLATRVALYDAIDRLGARFKRFRGRRPRLEPDALRDFGVAFAGAEIIVRTGEMLIGLARDRDLIWQKLDEEEMRYGIPRKRFTRLYRQLTSSRLMRPYYAARDYFDRHRDAVMDALQSSPDHAPIADILARLNLPGASRGDHLQRYAGFVRHSLRRRGWSAWRAIMFDLFESSGSDIAERRIPLLKPPGAPKRITAEHLEMLRAELRPGDVLVTRHDDALSNLFLPGFWPHSALFVGMEAGQGFDVLEAKKDGVLRRDLSETVQVDSLVVLRPRLARADTDAAIARGLSHAGKLYDFVFDFQTSDRLVCTEVIYRSYHGVGPVAFRLGQKAGRHCLSAEDLLNQGIGQGWFEPLMVINVGGEGVLRGQAARAALAESFESRFELTPA